jgi:hypothetical protein
MKGKFGGIIGSALAMFGMVQAPSISESPTEPMFKDRTGGYGQSIAGIPWKGGRLRPNRNFKKHTNLLKCSASARRNRKRK